MPWGDQVDVISSDDSASDGDADNGLDGRQSSNDMTIDQPTKELTSEGISTWWDSGPSFCIIWLLFL